MTETYVLEKMSKGIKILIGGKESLDARLKDAIRAGIFVENMFSVENMYAQWEKIIEKAEKLGILNGTSDVEKDYLEIRDLAMDYHWLYFEIRFIVRSRDKS